MCGQCSIFSHQQKHKEGVKLPSHVSRASPFPRSHSLRPQTPLSPSAAKSEELLARPRRWWNFLGSGSHQDPASSLPRVPTCPSCPSSIPQPPVSHSQCSRAQEGALHSPGTDSSCPIPCTARALPGLLFDAPPSPSQAQIQLRTGSCSQAFTTAPRGASPPALARREGHQTHPGRAGGSSLTFLAGQEEPPLPWLSWRSIPTLPGWPQSALAGSG